MKTCPLLAALLLVTFSFAPPAEAQPAAAAPKTHRGDGWAILAPGDWSPFAAAPPPVVVFLVGDGRAGVPPVDGTLSVVKAGLLIERFPAGKRTVKQRVENELKLLKTSGKFRPLAEPAVKEITLADGTAATVVDAAFVRLENGRVSTQTKVYAADAAGRHLVATGFLTCSRPGLRSVRAMGLPALLHAFATSMVLDPAKLDPAPVAAALKVHDWTAPAAVGTLSEANDLLNRKRYAAAAAGFRRAIAAQDVLPAAHNGLAWALLHGRNPTEKAKREALAEARTAVEQTDEFDPSALHTLALALDETGDRTAAVQAVEKALKLRPNDPDLAARLKSLQ